MDVPSPDTGVIEAIEVKVGDRVSTGSVIGKLKIEVSDTVVIAPAIQYKPSGETTLVAAAEKADGEQRSAGVRTLVVPDIGDFKDVEVIEVHVANGDEIGVEYPIVTLETDKAAMDVPAVVGGKIESVLVKVEVAESLSGEGAAKPAVELEVPAGLRLETPPVWIPSRGELAWRMKAERQGEYELTVQLGDESFGKSVQVTEDFVSRSPLRAVPGFVDQLLYPAEKPLPKGASVRTIQLTYPEEPTFLFMPRWMWIFFVLTIVFAFALRKPMKVTI